MKYYCFSFHMLFFKSLSKFRASIGVSEFISVFLMIFST